MIKVFICYKLKSGVTREQYRTWSREVDQPMAGRRPGVLVYRVWEIEGSGTEHEPFCDVMEEIGVEAWADWEAVGTAPEMQEVIRSFFALADPNSLRVVYGGEV